MTEYITASEVTRRLAELEDNLREIAGAPTGRIALALAANEMTARQWAADEARYKLLHGA